MTGLDANLQCPHCGRDFAGDDLLQQGDACPSDDCPSYENDWYARRSELQPGMVFTSCWGVVKLDRSVAGDGTKWFVLDGRNSYNTGKWGWYAEDSTIEPGDLTERLPDDYAGVA